MIQHNKTGYPSIDKPWLKLYSGKSFDRNSVVRTVYQYVIENNQDYLDSIAIKYKGVQVSYDSLIKSVENIAGAIAQYGLHSGDSVMMAATGVPEVIYILLACSKLGICVEMINFTLDAASIKNHILNSEAKLVFCLDRIHEKVKGIIGEKSIETVVIPAAQTLSSVARFIDGLSHKVDRSFGKTITYSEFLSKYESIKTSAVIDEGQPYIVVYTSGTTGNSKGIVHTNRSYTSMAEEYRTCEYPFGRGDCFLNQIPFFIASALSFLALAPIMLGVTVILEPEYDTKTWLKDIKKYKPEVIFGTTSFWETAIDKYSEFIRDLSFSKIIISGGEPINVETEAKVNEWIKKKAARTCLAVGYGMSELNGTITTLSYKYHRAGSVGIPLPDVIVGVFDTETGKELGYNQSGEIMAQSPCAMKEYSNMPDKTEQYWWKDSKGRVWARTGDVGMIDEFGEVYVYGRAVDSFMVQNKRVYFYEIENKLITYKNIDRCKVVINEQGQLKINLIISGEESNIEDKVLSDINETYDLPFSDMVCKVWKDFPLNANGKVDKIKLKKD